MKFFLVKKFDRVYSLCIISFFLSLVSFVGLLFFPLFYIQNSIESDLYISLLKHGSYLLIFIAIIPVIFTGILLLIVEKYTPPHKNSKINLWVTNLFFYSYVFVVIPSFGILYLPSIILLTGASVAAIIPRK